jgi:hypothetical protein
MIDHSATVSQVICGSRSTSGTIITIPADSVWCGDLFISASITVAATATPTITLSGNNAGPADGTVVHRLSITGLNLTTVTGSGRIELVVSTGANSVTLEFNTGGATSAACVANGFTL